jgi:hypothetical protein
MGGRSKMVNQSIESKLKHDADTGMPEIKLWNFDNMVVGVKNQKDYDKLMQYYEAGGWVWTDGDAPTEYPNPVNEKIYVEAADYFSVINNLKNLGRSMDIKLKDFCKLQDITPSKQKEINVWFDRHRPNRQSLMGGK